MGGGARGQIRNSETEAEVRSALVITNRRSLAWRDVRKNSGSGSAPKTTGCYIHSYDTELLRENDLELPGAFKGSLREGI